MNLSQSLEFNQTNKLLSGKRVLFLSMFLGAIYPLGFSPIEWWPLTLFSLMGLFWILQSSTQKHFLIGLFFGVGQFGVGTSWVYVSIHQFGNAPVVLALIITFLFVLYLALYPAIFSWAYGKWFGRSNRWESALAITFLWLLVDGLRGWVFSGFPWLYTGYAFIDTPLSNWAPIMGIHGITVLVLISALLSLQLIVKWNSRKLYLPLLLIWLSSWLLGFISWSEVDGKAVKTTLVQTSIPQKLKWEKDYFWKTIEILKQQTEIAKGEVVVWPEGAVPAFEDQVRKILQPIAKSATSRGQSIITGIPLRNKAKSEYYNGVVVISDKLSTKQQSYLKRRLVPFGEYVPLQNFLRGLIEFFDLPMSSFSLGPDEQAPLNISGINFGMAICYEITYPQLVYAQAKQSTVLLTISNDAWFGDSWGPEQHLQMARMRALETALPVVRATNNGITAFIDNKGKIKSRLQQNIQDNLEDSVQPQTTFSWVVHYHAWWTLVILLAILLMASTKLSTRPSI